MDLVFSILEFPERHYSASGNPWPVILVACQIAWRLMFIYVLWVLFYFALNHDSPAASLYEHWNGEMDDF